MLKCPYCGSTIEFVGTTQVVFHNRPDLYQCIGCKTGYYVDDPTEADAVDAALIEDALHGENVVVYEDDMKPYVPRWEDYPGDWD